MRPMPAARSTSSAPARSARPSRTPARASESARPIARDVVRAAVPVPIGGLTVAAIAALRLAGVRQHGVEPQFGPELGLWIQGLYVTLDLTPPRPVVQCVRGSSAADPDATVRGRYVARDDADAVVMFNACLRLWTRALPIECTLRGQRAHRRPPSTTRPAPPTLPHAA